MEFETRVMTLRAWLVTRMYPSLGWPPATLLVDEDGQLLERDEIEWLVESLGLSYVLPAPFSSHDI